MVLNLEQGANAYLLLISATLGNTLGSTLNYYFGLKGEKFLINKKMIQEKKIEKFSIFFNKYGGYSLLLSWVPIIGDPITFMAGISKYNFKKFLLIVCIAKMARYLFIILSWTAIFQPKNLVISLL